MSEFTKGKWEYHEYIPEGITLNGIECIISSGGEDVALARNEADARLITAAPKMYELLSVLTKIDTVNEDRFDDLILAVGEGRKLIARIDGYNE